MRSRPLVSGRLVAYAVAAVIILLIGVWLGGHPSWIPRPLRSAFVDQGQAKLVNEALDVLSRDYYRKINRSQLVDKGLAAAVSSLNDPYSHYFNPGDYHAFLNQSNPHLSGVGIEVLPESRGLRVTAVFPGSPAAHAGLTRGEVIVQVGSVSLAKRADDFGSRLIKGRAGTQVTLTVLEGTRKRVVRITRANLVVPVATGNLISYRGVKIGDLRLTSFTDGSSGELRLQTQKALHAGARALILDLRGNGGGLLDEAVKVASIFIPDGTIVSTAGRNQPRQVYTAKGDAIAPHIPMVVLVDRGTASAAEIVAGALKDRGRAKIVGTHTYGKGVFQEIETLSNGGALDITVGEYFTPSGRNLGGGGVREGAGIQPDLSASSNPRSHRDSALTVAEGTVAAEVR
jgi:carboxyl-terminal processing protease